MTVQLVALAFDAVAPNELAQFRAQALRWNVREVEGVGLELLPTDATTFRVLVRPVPGDKAPGGTGPKITWSGPPLMPKSDKERFHFHLAPASGISAQAALDRLLALGATRLDSSHGCPGTIALADVDGNELCLVEP